MKNKLRLVLFEECNRSCEGCCNYDWDLKGLSSPESYSDFDEVFLTGGEPMLNPMLVIDTINKIRKEMFGPIYMYTAKSKRAMDLIAMLHWLDGITLTLHEPYDVRSFKELNDIVAKMNIKKSLRLNIFKGIDITGIDTSLWSVKKNIEWIPNSPLPNGEVLMKLPTDLT